MNMRSFFISTRSKICKIFAFEAVLHLGMSKQNIIFITIDCLQLCVQNIHFHLGISWYVGMYKINNHNEFLLPRGKCSSEGFK